MALDYAKLLASSRELEQTYHQRDTLLYALGVGAGIEVNTAPELSYVYEENLRALPTMAAVLASPGFWLRDPTYGVDWKRVLHAEQSLTLHQPLPPQGHVRARMTVDEIYDKGAAKGALMYTTREIFDQDTGAHLATAQQGTFLRGDGGFSDKIDSSPKPHPTPADRSPDSSVEFRTRPEQALIYRLSGDYNPLHADPSAAQAAGFSRPILHGLATYGVVGRALLRNLCDNDTTRFLRMDCRFATPVFPGETIVTDIWCANPGVAHFSVRIAERNVIAIINGYFEFR
jgi:acyl dehydratase